MHTNRNGTQVQQLVGHAGCKSQLGSWRALLEHVARSRVLHVNASTTNHSTCAHLDKLLVNLAQQLQACRE